MLEKPVMESGGGGLVSTTMDYARFCQMLLNGGTLDGIRIIGRKTLELMASDHLGPGVKMEVRSSQPGHGFGLGFGVRTDAGIAPFSGSVGQFLERHGRNVLLDRSGGRHVRRLHVAGPRPTRIYPLAGTQSGLRGGGVTRGVSHPNDFRPAEAIAIQAATSLNMNLPE